MKLALVAASALGALSCGASIHAVYEGDVRFEHCMALDARPSGKPAIVRACWEEWIKFYTFGQTRDRIDYATSRGRELIATSTADEGELHATAPSGRLAVPEPVSALAPPPMMLSADAGLDAAAESPANASDDERPPPASACTAGCQPIWHLCRQECATAACEKTCSAKYKRCMQRCF